MEKLNVQDEATWLSVTSMAGTGDSTVLSRKIIKCHVSETVGDIVFRSVTDPDQKISIVHGFNTDQKEKPIELPLDMPVVNLVDFKISYLHIHITTSPSSTDHQESATKEPVQSAFDVFMRMQRSYNNWPDEREVRTSKDKLYNHVIKVMRDINVGFLPQQKGTQGAHMVQVLTDAVWFIDPHLDKFQERAIYFPELFSSLIGHRDLKRHHKKVPSLNADELQQHCNNLGHLLCSPWFLSNQFSRFREAVAALHEGVQKYCDYLAKSNQKSKARNACKEPIRGFQDHWSVEEIGGDPSVKPNDNYQSLIAALTNKGMYEPVSLQEIEPKDIKLRRKWYADLKLPFPISKFTFRFGNNLGNLNVVWKTPENAKERDSTEDIRIINDIKSNLPVYATRAMRMDFVRLYGSVTKLKPAHLRSMYQVLTGHVYSPENSQEQMVDERLCNFLLASDDPELVYDLRALNGRPQNPDFNPFWQALGNLLEESAATHERRSSSTCYLPFAISVEDLRSQVLQKLPPGSPAPSVSWLRLQFQPDNPYVQSAVKYTGQFNVRYKVQQRLLRSQHVDAAYGRAIFSYLKGFAIKWRNHALLQCMDDKAIIPVGEVNEPVSTGVRPRHRALTAQDQPLLALDHDYHVAGIIPSVCLMVDIPANEHDSFYRGTVHVTVKDKIFEPSIPLRHAVETQSIVQQISGDIHAPVPILLRYTDGGPDHRTSYRSVQMTAIKEFISLDLDMLVLARTAPCQSYNNPAERVMSLLNLGLQHVSLSRTEVPEKYRMKLKTLTTLKATRDAAQRCPDLKKALRESTEQAISTVKDIFGRLKWTNNKVQVHDAAAEGDLQEFPRLLEIIDPEMDYNNFPPKAGHSRRLDDFINRHCRQRHYTFQVKKCGDQGCWYCTLNPPRLSTEMFEDLHFLPDPVLDDDKEHFKTFDLVYGTETTDANRPSNAGRSEMSENDRRNRSLFIGAKARGYVVCSECGKRRVVHAAKCLRRDEELALKRIQEELLYVCGNTLFPKGPYRDVLVVKEQLTCESTIETTYYSDICIHCGDPEVLSGAAEQIQELHLKFGIVRPICSVCFEGGKRPVTRNAVQMNKAKRWRKS